jgi:hypothetical protein
MSQRIRYAFYDINSDGIEELFIYFGNIGLEEWVYAFADGEAHVAGRFCVQQGTIAAIDAQGNMYITGDHEPHFFRTILRLADDSRSFATVGEWTERPSVDVRQNFVWRSIN